MATLWKEKATNLITDFCPQVVLAKFAMAVDGEELHLAEVVQRPGRCGEYICGRPIDQFWRGPIATETVVVEIGLKLGDAMVRGVDDRGQAGGAIAVPKLGMR